MDRSLWILNIIFLIGLVVFIGWALWLAGVADRAHACLLDDACVEKYRAKIELEKKSECSEPRSSHKPTAHPTVIGGRPYVFFY
jgi:hypothetical protein